jgi:hypothetical protein
LTEYSAVSAGELEQTAEEYFTYRQERDEVGHKIEQLSYQIELTKPSGPMKKWGEETARMEELLERMHCADFSELEQKCERLRGLYRQKEAVSVAVSQIREDFGQCMARSEAALAETLQYPGRFSPPLRRPGTSRPWCKKPRSFFGKRAAFLHHRRPAGEKAPYFKGPDGRGDGEGGRGGRGGGALTPEEEGPWTRPSPTPRRNICF